MFLNTLSCVPVVFTHEYPGRHVRGARWFGSGVIDIVRCAGARLAEMAIDRAAAAPFVLND